MSHFYGSIEGGRGTATKGGTKASGISGHIRGWSVGARVDVNHRDGVDVVTVYATSGSGGGGHDVLILEFTADTIGQSQEVAAAMYEALKEAADYMGINAHPEDTLKKSRQAIAKYEAAQL